MFLGGAATTFVRYFSRKCSTNLKRINPKVPPQEASSIANGLYQIIKDNGPLTVSNAWNHAKDASISGLSSKTHMKIMLKWMRGRKMLKLFCTHVGSNKRFLHSTLPEDPQAVQLEESPAPVRKTAKPSAKRKKPSAKRKKKSK
ncbi:uncharacterized protein LOC131232650 [Magnolia sinica]|uniref:uncharacterized protein LOC131232650 n=1 Tax=Magnolia sinica TaxID=86752 RepID=UPI00265A05A6|nr:uncharacterized protein LOC131232650 [Magnolia sinica]